MAAGFDFARAQAAMLDKPSEQQPVETTESDDKTADSTNAGPAELQRFTATVNARITQLENQLNLINKRINSSSRHARAALMAQREKVDGELNLAKAQQDLIKTIVNTIDNPADAETGALLKKINNLARSTPSLNADAEKQGPTQPEAKTDTVAADATDHFANEGLIQLGGNMITIFRKRSEIQVLRQEGKDLRQNTKDLRTKLRTALQNIGRQGNTMAKTQADIKTLEQQKQDLDILTASFRQLSASVVPLSQTETWLDNSCRTLKQWRILLDDNLNIALRKFMIQLGILGIAIMIPVLISELARRMTMRYIQDKRRQRQLRLLRRFLLISVIVLIVAMNLASELGSIVTFAGFLTAGIAVALQNIILSLVAHFFFFGRYGVRAGDRVTVGGVTGDVTQVGMVRLYLAEVTGEGDNSAPTGRIVAFPNAILFQPTPFYKHIL
jgi:hypothetical protein